MIPHTDAITTKIIGEISVKKESRATERKTINVKISTMLFQKLV